MIEIAIMIEGQNGLNWPRWQRLVRQVEDLGYFGLYRSDHFTNATAPDKDSLDLWVSLTWLAGNTSRLQFGPLVTPLSFRHPTHTARMAAAVDDLSGGRLTLGVGAGWQEREHEHFGFDLLAVRPRFERFEEGLEVVTRLLNSDEPVDYSGKYYNLKEAILLPRPERRGGPPILIGGDGPRRTLPLAARYAREWNATFLTPEEFNQRCIILDELLEQHGRRRTDVVRSMMTGCIFARTPAETEQKVKERTGGRLTMEDLHKRGFIMGPPEQMVEQLQRFAEAGLQRIMLQWLDLDDLDGLEQMARGILHVQQ